MKLKLSELVKRDLRSGSSVFPLARYSIERDQLEKNGCVVQFDDDLNDHERDARRPCYCGRPNR
jgi:hypothetical protein